jgi:putative Mg2+ transporter-C (MgtC) family protein
MGVDDLDFLLRLLLATGCGLLIGLERQYRSRTAGLRTHALVAAGAAVFVLFGEQAALAEAPLQITAYVVSGVGFLGGGVILRQGFTVQGLNTAATLWCSAAVGCQAAAGHLIPALATTAVVLGVHLLLRPVGRLVDRAPAAKDEAVGAYTVLVLVRRKHERHLRAQLLQALTEPDVTVQGLATRTDTDRADPDRTDPDRIDSGDPATSSSDATVQLRADLLIEGNAATTLDAVVTRLSLEPGVRSVSWRSEDPDLRGDDDRDDESAERGRRRLRLGRAEPHTRAAP